MPTNPEQDGGKKRKRLKQRLSPQLPKITWGGGSAARWALERIKELESK